MFEVMSGYKMHVLRQIKGWRFGNKKSQIKLKNTVEYTSTKGKD